MSYGGGSFSQSGYGDAGSASVPPNLIESLGVITQYGVMTSPLVAIFAGFSPVAIGTFEGSSAFVPRPVTGSFSGVAGTQMGEMIGIPGHAILGTGPIAKIGTFVGASGAFSGSFAGVAATTIGDFSGGLSSPHQFEGVRSTAFGQFSAISPVTGAFIGPSVTRYGLFVGPAPDFMGYDTIHVRAKLQQDITVVRRG
ncbi:MAG: hypothetical protein A2Y38_16570 [Spirochaetes bacterium GWB1_59_5]|nr:MAG: hypothetical protein A2Y38_16570 [Spirochaetes bacterium GWB1_59_5]